MMWRWVFNKWIHLQTQNTLVNNLFIYCGGRGVGDTKRGYDFEVVGGKISLNSTLFRDVFDNVVFKAEAIDALVIVDAPMEEEPVVDSKLGDWWPPWVVCTWSPPPPLPAPAPLFFGLVVKDPPPPPAADRSFLMSVRRPILKPPALSCFILSKGIPRDPDGD